ncbi:MAG: NADH-quinone oxidoreductase subunit D [Holosporales bacterium]|jgi:NADH-quinone oxidoreductase subunit D|nr:NADH-quinone oxidoreductase subunit D [Holosporales bacterium]
MGIDVTKEFILSFGPHHPSTHGVLRLVLKMQGERIISCSPEVGYLHRGIEKMAESKKWLQIIPFLDRMDYLASLSSEHAYVISLEDSIGIAPSPRAIFIRTIMDELTRIASHVIAIGSATHDIGIMSLLLYCFEEREKILDIMKAVTGKRMHPAYYVPGGVYSDLSDNTIEQIKNFTKNIDAYIGIVYNVALRNIIFQRRMKEVGIITKGIVEDYGLTGPNARASGVGTDIRKHAPYAAYDWLEFEPIVSDSCDCYARILVRTEEIRQSASLIEQCIDKMPSGEYCSDPIIKAINNKTLLDSMFKESVFSYYFESGFEVRRKTRIYRSVESPRGELGIFLMSRDNVKKPHRLHVRAPSFAHIQALQWLLPGCDIPDATAIIGSMDFLISECDR